MYPCTVSWIAPHLECAAELFRPGVHVRNPHSPGGLVLVEAGAVIPDPEFEAAARGVERDGHVPGARMSSNVRQGFLRYPEKGLLRTRSQSLARRECPKLEFHIGAGAETKRLTLLLHGFDEAGIPERRSPELIQHRLHLGYGLACRAADLFQRGPGALGVPFKARLHRGGRGLDHEELLFDGIVQIPRQSVTLFLGGGLADLSLVLGA